VFPVNKESKFLVLFSESVSTSVAYSLQRSEVSHRIFRKTRSVWT
jgi:hypothetical protein